MFVCRIEESPKKYKMEDMYRIKYYNMLIKNHILEYHYADKDKEVTGRKIFNQELEYKVVRYYKYEHCSYIVGIEKNSLTNTDDLIFHLVTDNPDFDIFDTNTFKNVKKELYHILDVDIGLTLQNISIL